MLGEAYRGKDSWECLEIELGEQGNDEAVQSKGHVQEGANKEKSKSIYATPVLHMPVVY